MAAVEDTSVNKNGNNEESNLSEVEKKIVKQIEFYFGDKNYPRDKFLRLKAEEDDGWITFECLQTFSRLKALSVNEDTLVDSVKKSKSQLLEVSDDDKKVRRLKSVPLPENSVEEKRVAKAKTIYCKGFPKETTLDELEEFFGQLGKVVYIMMRKVFQTKDFKGSVFVEFSTVEEANKVLAKEDFKYKDQELIKMLKDDYYKKKNEERSQMKEEEKKKKAQERAEKERERKESEKDDEEEEVYYVNGRVLHFKGVGEQTSREDLKELFGTHEEIDWVDYARGETEGYVRFTTEGAAQRAIDAVKADNDGKIVIRDIETEVRVLEGDEEKEYFVKVKEEKLQRRQKKQDKSRGGGFAKRGRGGGRGRGRGRGGGGGRGNYSWREKKSDQDASDDKTEKKAEASNKHIRFDDEAEPPAKQIKTE